MLKYSSVKSLLSSAEYSSEYATRWFPSLMYLCQWSWTPYIHTLHCKWNGAALIQSLHIYLHARAWVTGVNNLEWGNANTNCPPYLFGIRLEPWSYASAEYWIHFTARFGVFRLPAAITPQWLQITGNSLPNHSSTGCLVLIFTVKVNSKSFPGLYTQYKKPPQSVHFSVLRHPAAITPQ